MLRYSSLAAAIVLVLIAVTTGIRTQVMGATSDADYIAKVSTGAPAAVVKGATIVQMNQDGTMQVLVKGTNGFTCMMVDTGTPGCADQNAMAWITALMTHAQPPTSVGFMYMLGGDAGASNTDPYAAVQTSSKPAFEIPTYLNGMILKPSYTERPPRQFRRGRASIGMFRRYRRRHKWRRMWYGRFFTHAERYSL